LIREYRGAIGQWIRKTPLLRRIRVANHPPHEASQPRASFSRRSRAECPRLSRSPEPAAALSARPVAPRLNARLWPDAGHNGQLGPVISERPPSPVSIGRVRTFWHRRGRRDASQETCACMSTGPGGTMRVLLVGRPGADRARACLCVAAILQAFRPVLLSAITGAERASAERAVLGARARCCRVG
jgi:hypothetical protein